jgi:hypothetical protein
MRGLVTAAIRIILIFVFLSTLNILGSNFYTLWFTSDLPSKPDFLSSVGVLLLIFLIIFVISWVLWWKAELFANYFAGSISDDELVINTNNTDLIKFVLRIVGICLIFFALPNVFGHVAYHIRYVVLYSGMSNYSIPQASEVMWWVTDAVQILIGIFLILWTKKPLNIVTSIRDFIEKPPEEDEGPNKN